MALPSSCRRTSHDRNEEFLRVKEGREKLTSYPWLHPSFPVCVQGSVWTPYDLMGSGWPGLTVVAWALEWLGSWQSCALKSGAEGTIAKVWTWTGPYGRNKRWLNSDLHGPPTWSRQFNRCLNGYKCGQMTAEDQMFPLPPVPWHHSSFQERWWNQREKEKFE